MDGVRSGYSAKTADPSTALRSVEKHSQRRTAGPQISPLRSFGAPVEMTKGRAALPATVVAEQDPFFIALGGPLAHDFSGRKTFPGKERRHRRSLHYAALRSR